MQIPIQCPQCGSKLKASDKLVGRELPCPQCGKAFVVRRPEPIADELLPEETLAELVTEDTDEFSEDFANLDLGSADLGMGDADLSGLGQGSFSNAYAAPRVPVPQPTVKPKDDAADGSKRTLVIAAVAGGAGLLVLLACGLLGVALWLFTGSADSEVAQQRSTPDNAVGQVEPSKKGIAAPAPADKPREVAEQNASAPPSAARVEPSAINAVIQPTSAAPVDVADTLESLKAATVYIQVESSEGISSGSGFLLERDGKSGVVITNSHVVGVPQGSKKITCLFHSGLATQSSANASVAGLDPDYDLAILRVTHDDLPAPLSWDSKVIHRETMPVLTLGFPLGANLATNSRGPAITVSKGSITSIRRDEYENVVLIQVDGGINPGNSGGPVVTEDGKLVGIAVAKISGADIGFAIAKRLLAQTMSGRVFGVKLVQAEKSASRHRYNVEALVLDPKLVVATAAVLTCAAEKVKEVKPDADGEWPRAHQEMDAADLSITRHAGLGTTVTGEVSTPATEMVYQIKLTRADGSEWFSQPQKLEPTQNPAVAAAAASTPPPTSRRPGQTEGLSQPVRVKSVAAGGNSLVEQLVWSSDGSGLFVLSNQGMLRKIDVQAGEVQLSMEFETACSFLGRSKEGLVLVMNAVQQVWSVDEETFEVMQKVRLPSAERIACSPASSFVYIPSARGIVSANLRTGQTKELSVKMGSGVNNVSVSRLRFLTLTPDGKYLFAEGGIEALTRMRVDADSVTVEAVSSRIGSNTQDLVVSSDSRYVAMPAGGGNGPVGYETYIYEVEDLQTPALKISSGAYPRRIEFDRRGNRVYAQNHDTELMVFNMGGVKQEQYRISPRGSGDGVRRFLAHPEGNRLCVLTESDLFLVEIPGPVEPQAADVASSLPGLDPTPPPTVPEISNVARPTKPSDAKEIGELRVTEINIDAKDQVGQLIWSEDSVHVFMLTKNGLLQKFSMSDKAEVQRKDFATTCSFLGRSKEGLVVVFDGVQKVVSVDETTMEVKQEVKIAGAKRIACAPSTSIAYATASDSFVAINLATGTSKAIQLKTGNDGRMQGQAIGRLRFLTLSPDGKYLFAADGNALQKLQVGRDVLVVEEMTASIASAGREVVVSADSHYVAYLSGGGNRADGHPNVGYGTYIYDVENLKSPEIAIATGAYPVNLGFDSVARKFYAQNHEKQLIVVSSGGVNEGEYTLDGRGSNVRCFLVHPQGQRLFILTDQKLLWVELTADLPPLQAVVPEAKAISSAPASNQKSSLRTWSDATGKFRVSARLIEIRDNIAVFEKEDGTRAEVPIERLSQADQNLLKKLQAD